MFPRARSFRDGQLLAGGPFETGAIGWFNAPAFADMAAVADFNLDRYAITTVPLGSIPTATADELCVKRACTFAEFFAFTASSTTARTYFDVGGTLRNDLAVDQPRFDWSLGKRQLVLSSDSTNTIRNTAMSGAVPGTPGTLPTNFQTGALTAGISREIVGTGTEDGLPYIDIRYFGTATATNSPSIAFEPFAGTTIAAATGQNWTLSCYHRLIAQPSGLALAQLIIDETASGAYVTGAIYSIAAPTTASLRSQRVEAARTFSGGGTVTGAAPQYRWSFTNGVAYDFTVRIGALQFEQGNVATDYIPTAGAAVTRAVETAELAPVLEAIMQRASFGVSVRGQNLLKGAARIVGAASTGPIIRAASNRLPVLTEPTQLATGNGTDLRFNPWAVAAGFDGAGRSIIRNGVVVQSDATVTALNRSVVYLGRDQTSPATVYGDGNYDFMGIFPARPSDVRLAELVA